MKIKLTCISFIILLFWVGNLFAKDNYPAPNKGCLTCHGGIEFIRPNDSQMAEQIYALGDSQGDPNGCVICHGGNPNAKTKQKAHLGVPNGSALSSFTPVPGALSVAPNTCGLCHTAQVSSVPKSMMNTDSGKIKVITYGWGLNTEDHKHRYANHKTIDEDGEEPIYGTKEYKDYVKELISEHKDQFPNMLEAIPKTNLNNLKNAPETAVYNYLRNCNACHLQAQGKKERGHFRGYGCSACHIPFGTEGFYEGKDKSINKKETGHLLVHSIQAGRNSIVKVGDGNFTGINISTCNACHSSGRRVSLQYQGLFATDKHGEYVPFDDKGKMQQPNATYLYKYIEADVHFKAGMLCQDCHTSADIHGDGNIGTVALGVVEIECQDCHGTPKKYPWELPLGTGEHLIDKSKIKIKNVIELLTHARGLGKELDEQTQNFGSNFDKKDGYLLSARGNPLGNVVKDGDKVILHSASGKDLIVPILKDINDKNLWQNPEGKLAMVGASKHLEKMECYACHARWASSYYGYDYSIDFSKNKEFIDWVESAENPLINGLTADRDNDKAVMQPGSSDGDYSHSRWESPVLGINAEGLVSPLVGVIQTVGTVIDKDGKILLLNNVAKTKNGILAIDMQPMNPHTTTKAARACLDCHLNSKTMGFGMGLGDTKPQSPVYMGIKDANGRPLSSHAKKQINGIKNLNNGDFMTILDENGTQIMSVGTHFKRSGPLTKEQRKILSDPNFLKEAKDNLKNKHQ